MSSRNALSGGGGERGVRERGVGEREGVNWRVNSLNNFCSQKDFLGSSYIRVYQVDSSLGFTKEFQKN